MARLRYLLTKYKSLHLDIYNAVLEAYQTFRGQEHLLETFIFKGTAGGWKPWKIRVLHTCDLQNSPRCHTSFSTKHLEGGGRRISSPAWAICGHERERNIDKAMWLRLHFLCSVLSLTLLQPSSMSTVPPSLSGLHWIPLPFPKPLIGECTAHFRLKFCIQKQ